MVRSGLFWLVTALTLIGCAGSTTAPVQDLSTPRVTSLVANDYIVRRGDTLYSIAFRYGLDFKTLAQLNNIRSPYTIVPGQRLIVRREGIVRVEEVGGGAPVIQLTAASSISSSTPSSRTKSTNSPSSSTSVQVSTASTSTVPSAAVSDASVSRVNKPKTRLPQTSSSRGNTSVVATKSSQTVAKPKAQPAKTKQKISQPVAAPAVSNSRLVWHWPHNGTVVRNFSTKNSGNKGLNIRGRSGDAVKAAGDGTVVYAGANLRGYGNLIIVNHNEKFLSAYGHNRKILVKEGDKVKAGAQIAEMGNSGADAVMLHFEIRRNGVPVNPAAYLPKR